jgi:hypothetical protein
MGAALTVITVIYPYFMHTLQIITIYTYIYIHSIIIINYNYLIYIWIYVDICLHRHRETRGCYIYWLLQDEMDW